MDMTQMIKEMSDTITNTREFRDLKAANNALNANPSAKSKWDEFKKNEQLLYSGRLSVGEMERLRSQLGTDYESLSKIPAISQTLSAGEKLDALLNNIFRLLHENIEKALLVRV